MEEEVGLGDTVWAQALSFIVEPPFSVPLAEQNLGPLGNYGSVNNLSGTLVLCTSSELNPLTT